MHPNLFLRTYWKANYDPIVFVAMSFDATYNNRWNNIYVPSISKLTYEGETLKPWRVNLSRTGDSIITEIMDGIANSVLVLCDVSVVGKDSSTNKPFRNGNVMYEVGLALASRHSSDVLLVRDDDESLLFDVSTIPHIRVDFSSNESAINSITNALQDRLTEQSKLINVRAEITASCLTQIEAHALLSYADQLPGPEWFKESNERFRGQHLSRFLEKGLLVSDGQLHGPESCSLTPLGRQVTTLILERGQVDND